MATRPASKLNLQELGIPDEIELVDKQGRTDLASLTQRIDDITPPDNIDISEDGVKVYANYDVNELGWGCEDKTYYFDTAAEFSLGDRTYTKTNAKPAFGGVIGTPGDGQNHAIVLVSTEADATYFSWNSTANSFEYNGTTWYYCGGNYAYWGSPATGISAIPDGTLSLENAARYMLDYAQVYVDDGKFSEIAEPNSGYLFAGGGSQDDYSDATFKVSKEGVVTAQDVEINGESITDKIDNIIDDTTSSDGSTWSSNKITEEIEDKSSVTKTAEGNPIEITDGADAPLVKCVTEIQGSQDLHGYEKPWVGGAGKNKFDKTTYTFTSEKYVSLSTGNIGTNSSYACTESYIPCSDLAGQTITLNHIPGGTQPGMAFYDSNNEYINGGKGDAITVPSNAVSYRFTVPIEYASGDDVQIELGSTSTSYKPYSNICPITAYTEGEISVGGRNIINNDSSLWEQGEISNSTGQNASSTIYTRTIGYFPIDKLSTIVMSGFAYTNATELRLFFYDKDDNFISYKNAFDDTYTLTNADAVKFRARYKTSISIDNLMIEYGTTHHTYEPYVKNDFTTTFPSAIYRGSEDVVNGKVTSDMPVIDLGDLTWSAYTTDTTGHSFYVNVPTGTKTVSTDSSVANLVCEIYETVAFINPSEWLRRNAIICQVPNAQRWIVRDERYSDATSFASAMSGVKLAYELAAPTTSSVTPTNLPIKSLSGYNHIESSTGEMDVEYITQDYQPLVDLIESNKHVYSTVEQIVGTWVDGSTIYEKTIYDAGGQSGAVTFAHGISNFGKLISIEGNCYDNQESMYMPFPRVGPDGNNIGIVAVDSTNVQYAVAGAFSTRVVDVYLTIRYTKTTTQTNSLSLSNSETDQVDDNVLDKDSDTDTEDA